MKNIVSWFEIPVEEPDRVISGGGSRSYSY